MRQSGICASFVLTAAMFCSVHSQRESRADEQEAAQNEEGFVPLFDGKSLAGWEGDKELWKVEDEMIVGDSPGIKHNEFLATKKSYGDFELRLEFRLRDGAGNTGVQFRSRRVEGSSEVSGYQADIGEKYWGCLYDESRRNKILVQAPVELDKVLHKDGWNEYVIRAEGNHIRLTLGGIADGRLSRRGRDNLPRRGHCPAGSLGRPLASRISTLAHSRVAGKVADGRRRKLRTGSRISVQPRQL